ncbi:MAG: PKD domain-containing protein, partial [Bacteroidota bacterium]
INVVGDSAAVLVVPFGMTTYYLLARDSIGCPIEGQVTVEGRGIDVMTPDQLLICQGELAQLELTNLDPVDQLTYAWTPEALILSGQNTPNPIIQPDLPGTYTFEVALSNQFGCTTTDSVQVNVLDTLPQIDFLSEQQCSGFTVNFSNTGPNAAFYQWNFGDPAFPDSFVVAENPSYTYPAAGTYSVMLTYFMDVNCPDTLLRNIEVGEPDIVPAFDWSFEACGDSVLVRFTDLSINTQSNIIAWDWDFGNGQSSTMQNPNLQVTEDEDLLVQLTIRSDDGCEDMVQRNVPVDLIEVELADTLISCLGVAVPLNPNFDPTYVYQWSPSEGLDDPTAGNPLADPSETTTYSVTVTDFSVDTCQVVRTVTAIVPPVLELQLSEDTMTCGEEVTLMAQSNMPQSIEWSLNPDFSNILSTMPSIVVAPETAITYFARVTDDFGCVLTDEVLVSSNAVFTAAVDVNLCRGDSTRLQVVNLNPEHDLSYLWSPAAAILDADTAAMPLVSPQETTSYSVGLSNQFGCTGQANIVVNVVDNINDLAIDASPDTIFVGQSAQLNASFDSSFTYQWLPDTTLSDWSIHDPIASPTMTTRYFLTVSNENACERNGSVEVVVVTPECVEPFIFFPSAFSPNGDGENETLRLYGRPIDEAYWVIYNRWGEKVFEAFSAEAEWDGTFKGELLTPDVFGFYLEVRCIGGEEYFKKGNITLLR